MTTTPPAQAANQAAAPKFLVRPLWTDDILERGEQPLHVEVRFYHPNQRSGRGIGTFPPAAARRLAHKLAEAAARLRPANRWEYTPRNTYTMTQDSGNVRIHAGIGMEHKPLLLTRQQAEDMAASIPTILEIMEEVRAKAQATAS